MRRAIPSARAGRARQTGVSLIEALVAMLVMSLGMLALVGVQTNLRANSDVARQRAEATRIASREMENLRFFTSIDPVSGQANQSYSELAARTESNVQLPDNTSNTSYTLERSVSRLTRPDRLVVQVKVTWTDRSDVAQSVVLDSLISGADPRLGALLMTPAIVPTIASNRGRHPSIPPAAVDLGTTSAFKPPNSGGVVWVFNNTTGVITSTCTGVTAAASSITAADLVTCSAITGQLLSGTVRFNFRGGPKDMGNGTSAYKPVNTGSAVWVFSNSSRQLIRTCTSVPTNRSTADLTLADTTCTNSSSLRVAPFFGEVCNGADCADATVGLQRDDALAPTWPALNLSVGPSGGAQPMRNLASGSTRGSVIAPQCFSDAPATAAAAAVTTKVSYFCLIVAKPNFGWGGQFNLQPAAFSDGGANTWQVSGTGAQYKVCRYSTATIDKTVNPNHPKVYCLTSASVPDDSACEGDTGVRGNLTNQNFLVIDADKTCPTDSSTVSVTGGTLVNVNTRPHQP